VVKISPECVTGPEQGKSSGRIATFSLWTGVFRDGIYLLYGRETWTVKASDARRITAAEMKYMRRTAGYTWDRLQNKCTNCKGFKNNTNFGQITGIQEKLDTTCK